MKEVNGQNIVPKKIYRNFMATTLDFNPVHLGLYFVRQLPSGLMVAKDCYGMHRRVWSQEEILEMYGKKQDIPTARLRASQFYPCDEQGGLIL